MNKKHNHDKWVFWFTGIFVLIAFAVFTFAIIRNKKHVEGTKFNPSSTELATTGQQEFKLVRVIDGDSLVLIGSDGIDLSIRLQGIDAPELGQQYGFESKEALKKILNTNTITLGTYKKGKYGRYVANVFVNKISVNSAMVASGYAWYDQVNSNDNSLHETEKIARKNKLGIWGTPEPIPPWVWRAGKK